MRSRLLVMEAVHAHVQDLGRPGHAGIGISPNGAADQHAACTANVLVGNTEGAPLIEIVGSVLAIRCESDVLVSVTGAAEELIVDGLRQPAWELIPARAGAVIRVSPTASGLRSYLAFNGLIDTPAALGSVAPDPFLGFGRTLSEGDELVLDSGYVAPPTDLLPLYRLGAHRPTLATDGIVRIDVTAGPDADRLIDRGADLGETFQVTADSNTVGLRLDGPKIGLHPGEEILSRGVPVGAVQVPHSGGVIVLLRGRLVTAGYPVVAVATTVGIDALGQLRPGDRLRLRWCTTGDAVAELRWLSRERRALAARVRAALTSRGLSAALAPQQDD